MVQWKTARPARLVLPILFAPCLLLPIYLLTNPALLPPDMLQLMHPSKQCPSIILITAPRHGSTWLLNTVHRCRFSVNGTFTNLNLRSEMWVNGKPALRDVTADEAVEYVRTMSVKLFPQSMKDPQRMRDFLTRAQRRVVFLKRDLIRAERSMARAREEGVWNSDFKGERGEDPDMEEDDGENVTNEKYGRSILKYMSKARVMLKEVGRSWAEVEYEKIVNQRIIWLGDCWVRNCNFV